MLVCPDSSSILPTSDQTAVAKDQQGGRGCGFEFAIQNGSSDTWLNNP